VLQPLAFADLGKAKYQALFGKDPSADFSSPDGLKVLGLYDQMQPYWMPGAQTQEIDGADQAFAQGKAAWDIGGTFTLAFLQQNGMKPDDVMAFGLPAPADGAVPQRALGPLALTGLTIASTSKHPDNAEKWMKFLAGQQVAAQFAKDATDVPATELGGDTASVMGATLTDMLKTFNGTPDTTYDPSLNDFRPPTYDQDSMGDVLADLTPLGQKSVAQTGKAMAKLDNSFWATSK
jgi:multiple sugar transport system substrate-binding protein